MAYKTYKNGDIFNANELNALQDLIQKKVDEQILESRKISFPIGSRYITQSADINPSTILGFGTWERFKGLVALGIDENDVDLNAVGKKGGEKTHILTIEEMPEHDHPGTPAIYRANEVRQETEINAQTGKQGRSGKTGGNKDHNNMQPYEVVGYMWIRRA